jgi:O-antigen/teichoic acid export membrane protein
MKKTITLIATNPLFSGSLIMFLGGGLGNLVSYAYHLVLGRLIGPAQYGELTTILSFLGIFLALFSSIVLVIMKFVAEQNRKQVASVYAWINREVSMYLMGLCLVIALLSPVLADIFQISISTMLIVPPIIFFSVLALMYGALLQGVLRFGQSIAVNTISIVLRLVVGVFLLYAGFMVFGIVFGILIASFSSFLLARHFISKLHLPHPSSGINRKEMLSYSFPVIITALSLGSIFSTDMLLVKHFFDAHSAGIYGSLSMLGKIIFYLTSPIVGVMFPIAVAKRAKGEKTLNTFLGSVIFASTFSFALITVYILFPNLTIKLLYGSDYAEGSKFLLSFGVFSALYSLVAFTSNYLLSLGYTRTSIFAALAATGQITGILYFHSSISDVINVSIISTASLLLVFLLYAARIYRADHEVSYT